MVYWENDYNEGLYAEPELRCSECEDAISPPYYYDARAKKEVYICKDCLKDYIIYLLDCIDLDELAREFFEIERHELLPSELIEAEYIDSLIHEQLEQRESQSLSLSKSGESKGGTDGEDFNL
jgi:hypothetical protein